MPGEDSGSTYDLPGAADACEAAVLRWKLRELESRVRELELERAALWRENEVLKERLAQVERERETRG